MALDVIGAGFGRTGTLSMKAALERLGFDKCHHMAEVFANPEQADVWRAAARGEPVDWDALLDGYRATVDWPACVFWRELADRYPEAKIVLNVRDPEGWFDSFHETIYQLIGRITPEVAGAGGLPAMAQAVLIERSFGGALGTRAEMIGAFNAHNEAVRVQAPPDRLLEYEVSQGWEPLCEFLGVGVPAEEFPRVNDRDSFWQIFGGGQRPPPLPVP